MPAHTYANGRETETGPLTLLGQTLKDRASEASDRAMAGMAAVRAHSRDMADGAGHVARKAADGVKARPVSTGAALAVVGVGLAVLINPRLRGLALAAAPALWKMWRGR